MFNYHHHQVADRPADVALLSELGSPDTLEVKDKLYMLAGAGVAGQSRFYGKPYDTAHPHQLPRDFESLNDTITLRVNVADDLANARYQHMLSAVTLTLDLCHITGEEKLDLTINNIPVPIHRAHFAPSSQYPWNWNGHMGHFELKFDLYPLDCIQQGDNHIALTLRGRPDDIGPRLQLYTLKLEIKYRALPMGIN
ncbi:MAG: hypothetical protein CMJ49_14825 [Planctomycetaceae bacterium]|nr:hypothetical protein [Planctomycetaceae bacterium]